MNSRLRMSAGLHAWNLAALDVQLGAADGCCCDAQHDVVVLVDHCVKRGLDADVFGGMLSKGLHVRPGSEWMNG